MSKIQFKITKEGFQGNVTGSLEGTASYASTASYLAPTKDYNVKDLDASGNVTILGNLTVKGTQTIVETQELKVKDKLVEIASGSNTRALIDNAGIQIGAESLNAAIKYQNLDDSIATQKNISASGYIKAGSSNDYVLLGGGSHILKSDLSPATASTAIKLTSTSGSLNRPVYIDNGVPTSIGHSIASDVPANAKFSDTTYTGSLSIKGNNVEAIKFDLSPGVDSSKTLNLRPGSNISITASEGTIEFNVTDSSGSGYIHPTFQPVAEGEYYVGRDYQGHVLIGDVIDYSNKGVKYASMITGSTSKAYFNESDEFIIEFNS